jgi:hypothetical protein
MSYRFLTSEEAQEMADRLDGDQMGNDEIRELGFPQTPSQYESGLNGSDSAPEDMTDDEIGRHYAEIVKMWQDEADRLRSEEAEEAGYTIYRGDKIVAEEQTADEAIAACGLEDGEVVAWFSDSEGEIVGEVDVL